MAPLDGDNNFCGITTDFEDYEHLFVTNLVGTSASEIFESGVCVKKCPMMDNTPIECKTTSKVTDCNDASITRYNTKKVIGYCFPASKKALPKEMHDGWDAALQAFMTNPIGKYFNDLYLSSRAIYWSCAMGMVYCFIFIYIMSAYAETIAWICIALVQIGLIGASVGTWF
jgi:hypothetical protein